MAEITDLMNTQTGGEGETVQIQTQENVSPDQFDVNIKSQVQETPTEPPVQKQMTEPEFQPTQPSVFTEQEVFNAEPPIPTNLQEGAPTDLVTEQEPLEIPKPILDIPPFGYESYAKYKEENPDMPDEFFVDTPTSQINYDLKKSGTENIVDIYDENKEKGKGLFGRIKETFKRDDSDNKSIRYEGGKLDVQSGDQISKDAFLNAGGDIGLFNMVDKSAITGEPIVKEEEDLTGIVDKGGVLDEFNQLSEQLKQANEELKLARKENAKDRISSLKEQRNALRNSLSDLQKQPEYKEQSKTYKDSVKKGESKGLCMDVNSDNYLLPGPCRYSSSQKGKVVYDYTFHPSNYVVTNPMSLNVSNDVFRERLKNGVNDQRLNTYMYQMFAKPSDLHYYGYEKGGAISEKEAAQTHVKNVIYENGFSFEELKRMDQHFQRAANWARGNGGKENGKLKAALFPYFGNLPEVTVEVKDNNGRVRNVTLFKGIQEDDNQKNANKNGFGTSPWDKGSFQYKVYETVPKNVPYWIPNNVINVWEKEVKGFSVDVLKQQQLLARRKDKDGEPYLKSNKGVFGVGVTGVMDDATREAQRKFDSDWKASVAKKKSKQPIKDVTGGFSAKGAEMGQEYDIERDNPIYKFNQTGKPTGAYGTVPLSKIPLKLFKNTSDAIYWANGNLPDNRKDISFIDSDVKILGMDQDDFKGYIDKLGTGVTVETTGGLLDWDSVVIYPPKGSIATPLEIDLGENNYSRDKAQLKRLSDYLNNVQVSPRSKFIEDYTAANDPTNYVSNQINKQSSLNNEYYFSGKTDDGLINITSEEGRSKLNGYTQVIKQEQERLQKDQAILDAKMSKYNTEVQPFIKKFQDTQAETNKQMGIVDKQLNELEANYNADKISYEDFDARSKELNSKMTALQSNLYNSYTEMQKAVGGNKELANKINQDYADVQQRAADFKNIADNIDELAGIQLSLKQADVTGPKTVAGSIASGVWKGFLQPYVTSISAASDLLIQAGVYPEGMTKEEALKMNNDWKSDFLYGELSENLLDSMGAYKSQSYIEGEDFITKALSGVAESVGTQLNPLVRSFKGTPLEKVASFMGFASMSYNNMEQEILNSPDLKALPEYQKKLIAIPYAIGMGVVEQLGYGKILRGDKSSLTQKLMTGIINQSLKRLPKNATLESIEAVIKGDIKATLPKLLRAAHSGGMVELETEMLQENFDVGIRKLANSLLDKDAFNTPTTMEDYMKQIVKSGAAGYIGGAALGGTMRSIEKLQTGNIKTIDPADYNFFKVVANDSNLKELYSESVANKFISGEITKEQAEKQMLDFENLAAIDKKISDQITGEDRVSMVDLMLRKQEIQERMKELDESQKNLPNPELDAINTEINNIVVNTESKIKQQQEYDKQDEQGVSSEIGEGQESIETQPVTETSQEEVSPGGMVQEEQTELEQVRQRINEFKAAGNEEVLGVPENAEPGELGRLKKREKELSSKLEVTPTEPEKITSVMTTGETQIESDLIGQDVSTGKQLKTADIQTGEVTSEFREDKNPTKGKVVNVEADPRNKNIERLILEDGTVLNRNKNTGNITLNNKVKASTVETEVKGKTVITNEFDELAEINKMTSPAKKNKAMKAFNEKYGEKAARISQIDSNFTSIVSKLEGKELIKKKC